MTLVPFGALSLADQTRVWEMRTHPDISRWMTTRGDFSLDDHLAYIRRQGSDTRNLNFLASDAAGIMGVVSIHRIDRIKGEGHLGMYRSPWRADRGVGTRLLAAIIDRALDGEGLALFRLEVARDNDAAIRLYRRFGFVEDGEAVEPDQLSMSLSGDDRQGMPA